MRVSILLPFVALISGCATPQDIERSAGKESSEQARLARTLEGFTAGEPRSCVDTRDLRGPRSYGKNTLVFQASTRLYYVNKTNGSCDGVGKGDALVTRQLGSQMCRGDIAHAADLVAGFQTGNCALGEFVPYRRN